MTEKVTTKKAEKKPEQTPEIQQIVDEKPKSKSKLGLGFIILLFLIIIISMIGFYVVQKLSSEQEAQQTKFMRENERVLSLTKQLTSIQAQLAATQKLLTTVDADVTSTDDVFTHKLAEFSKINEAKLKLTHADLKEDILKLQRQLGKTRGDWLMADAEYLLSVANQRLHLVGDLKTTLEALKAADERLHESGDGAAFKIRAQITKEITSLKDVTVNDIVGSYAQLKSLIDTVDRLTLILPYAEKPLKKDDKKLPKRPDGVVEVVLKQIDGYVTVRHNEKEVETIITHEEAKLIKQQLSIKLEMIKIALVQENIALYERSMVDTLEWLKKHFIMNKVSKTFIDTLKTLKKEYVNAELPDISLSLKMLRDISKLRIETDKALQNTEVKKEVEGEKTTEEKPSKAPKTTLSLEVKNSAPIKKTLKPNNPKKTASPETLEIDKKRQDTPKDNAPEKVTKGNAIKENTTRVSPQQ
ncbi:MAG: uroporphyrinogen-III C-methyltransferase [Methylococcales bacterium]|nr:uroporphyrinogen-III C-methyltransferase [Methylococcales bacterium]